jgi:hypothetical protein
MIDGIESAKQGWLALQEGDHVTVYLLHEDHLCSECSGQTHG